MWAFLLPLIAQMASKNNPNASSKINSAMSIMHFIDKDKKW